MSDAPLTGLPSGMMRTPLGPTHFLERAASWFGEREVVTVTASGTARHPWATVLDRVRRLVTVLRDEGVAPGDRVASLAWNTHRHLELFFAVPAMGAVLLTVNVRLSAGQIARILDHGRPALLFADPGLADAIGADRLPTVLLGPDYEARLAGADPVARFPVVDEQASAGLCYTSGTTGEPKGVLTSHRAVALHTLGICLPDGFGLSERDVILPAVPLFHAHAWGLPYAAAMCGAGLVLPGERPDAERIADLLAAEEVTFAAGVPTVWMAVLEVLRSRPRALAAGLRIHCGGAPSPPSLIEAYRTELGVEVVTGWGMTELSPVGMATHPRAAMAGWDDERLLEVRTSQGTPLPFVEARLVDDAGQPVSSDGRTPGELEVRGPWVTGSYYRHEAPDAFRDGWLRTGDVATRDALGYVRLVDRTRDMIRSGGEWISSVQLEHALMEHPAVAEAAVVAVPDPRWQERPLACVVLHPDRHVEIPALLAPLRSRFPKWWVPDEVVFLDRLPRTATGKFDKRALRARYRDGPS